MEFSFSRPASPRSTPPSSASPPPAMQTKEVCDTRRMLVQRLDILRAQHDEAYAYLCPIEEKFQDTTSEFYQGATPCISLLSKQEPRRRVSTTYFLTVLILVAPTTLNYLNHLTKTTNKSAQTKKDTFPLLVANELKNHF
ncbi:hypothetical protein NPIL_231781 [Nephila pilipes]|uniref:Uncharacterized protein n=1 Tax=Nephila pilipes TaxID=299642 RepID=A0A8X6TAH6_NEPPI|nr:hypothetical protein NPIL_231781 [Nephila pilipes]